MFASTKLCASLCFRNIHVSRHTRVLFSPLETSSNRRSFSPSPAQLQLSGARLLSTPSFIQSALETQAGWFKSLSESSAVGYAQDYFQFVHDLTGLSWWSSILFSTLLVRTCITFPLSAYQAVIFARIENLKSEMPAIVRELKMETAIAIKKFKWTEQQARRSYNRSLKRQWNNLIVRDNCHPFKGSLLILVQLPMWVCLSVALRNMTSMLPVGDAAAHFLYLELCLGGCLWIPNLTFPDTSFILPVALGLVNLAIIEIQTMTRTKQPKTKIQRYVTNFFRIISIAMIPIAASVPSCMSLYWTASSVCGLTSNLVLMSPKVRRFFRIPHTPEEVKNPYKHLLVQIKHKLRLS